ncbi:GHKL domain-containing protein, partial [Nostoc sp. UCD122]|nr:GHKL domain-containing protein [Nostoc sp. UCD122]
KVKQVFINIVRNACEAVSAGDTIKWEVDSSSPDQICINVCNGGEPIPSEVLSKLTQPFFSTKPSGTGLGLAISKRIINAHGGELSIESDTMTGTKVSVQLPVVVLGSL